MAIDISGTLIAVLNAVLKGTALTEDVQAFCTDSERVQQLIRLAKKHDMAHMLGWALKQQAVETPELPAIQKDTHLAIYRYETSNYEYQKICKALEMAEIPFMPLKGAVLRKYYPEPWMRTSCDIDILFRKEDVERAVCCLKENCGGTYMTEGTHDISLMCGQKVHVELHYDLLESDRINKRSQQILKLVWETAGIREGHQYWYEMSDELFYFYHIIHMAKHFKEGGCGIRPFVDLWLLDRLDGVDLGRRDALLEQSGLLKFAQLARGLSRVWFGNQRPDAGMRQMEEYVLNGGVYGNGENRGLFQRRSGKFWYILSRIYLSPHEIKWYYPVLVRHPWLTPFMQVGRWFRLLFCGFNNKAAKEFEYSQNITKEQANDMKQFLNDIGL